MIDNFLVEFGQEINRSLKEKSGLVPFFQKIYEFFPEYMLDYKLFHLLFDIKPKANLSLLRELLNTDRYFDNELFLILFRAFVYAETRFIKNYIPQNSHEERLTGHLISEYTFALDIVKKTFQEKAYQIYKENLSLDFYYADLSSNNREKSTGADFGIMFHINLPDYPDEVRIAIFQAKKIKTNVVIDIAQYNTLKNYGEKGAYYCFYDMATEATSSPLVMHANNIDLTSSINKKTKSYPINELFKYWDSIIPLSLFLIVRMLISDNNNFYKSYKSIWDAKSYFENNNLNETKPGKLLMVSIGGLLNSSQDLTDLSRLLRFPPFEEQQ